MSTPVGEGTTGSTKGEIHPPPALPIADTLRQRPFGSANGAYTPPHFGGQDFFFVCRKKNRRSAPGRPARDTPTSPLLTSPCRAYTTKKTERRPKGSRL
jgi:hypothetical protein